MCKPDNLIAGAIIVVTSLIVLGAIAITLIDTLNDRKER